MVKQVLEQDLVKKFNQLYNFSQINPSHNYISTRAVRKTRSVRYGSKYIIVCYKSGRIIAAEFMGHKLIATIPLVALNFILDKIEKEKVEVVRPYMPKTLGPEYDQHVLYQHNV